MGFINPIFLLGLLGVGIPVVIHMMGKKRAPIYKFSAIEFILRSQKKVAARVKLEQLLLLALRVAIIALIASALARPVLKAGPVLGPDTPSCNVLIVDNSYSMGYSVDGKSLLDTAREWARRYAASLSPLDEACVLAVFPAPETLPQPTDDKGAVLDDIDRVEASYYTSDTHILLERAATILSSSRKNNKRMFFFTDLTKSGWDSEKVRHIEQLLGKNSITLHVVDVTEGQALNNMSVGNLECEYDWTKKDGQIFLTAEVNNFTDQPTENMLVKVRLGEEGMSQGFLQIGPRGAGTKEFMLDLSASAPAAAPASTVRAGNTCGTIEIPADSLQADDKRFFTIPAVEDVRVLVIDGAPGISIYQSETFYLEKALNPARFNTSHVIPTVVSTDEAQALDFGDFDLVILANVERLRDKKVSELKTYAAEGGRVFFCLGDKVDTEYYNSTFAGLVPRLRMVVKFPSERPLEFDTLDTTHTLLRVFAGERRDVLSSPSFSKVFLVEPEMDGRATAIISYSNGAPALLETPYGKGRSMTLTTTISRDWTDLPVKPIFLPLVQQICRYMTDNLVEATTSDILVGDGWELPFLNTDIEAEKAVEMKVLDPKGNLTAIAYDPSASEGPPVFAETHFPGIYKLRLGDKATPFTVAVNVDSKEGDLSRVDRREVTEILGEGRTSVRMSGPLKGAEGSVEGKRLWPTLLLAALCFLCVEAFVSWRQL
ncbi:MAG: VWA domain-containing protein [Planctomycetes bacterium]|nr:VWA domain-containing protein [Planctomycetota bacterium]